MPAPQEIIDLVEKYKENEKEYKNPNTKEEVTKVNLITPFFKAMGWDVENEQNLPLRYQEVDFETQVTVDNSTKLVDYSFRLEGKPIFFVEAKKPSRNIATSKEHAHQVRKYGWNAELPICILTDFEEFAIYDTTFPIRKDQGVKVGRLAYYKYTEYIDKWDEIYNIFSKEAVQTGKFDEYAGKKVKDKKGTQRVDVEFLKEIEEWRLLLARNIALRNPDLNIESLNYAVQLIIDRIIFLRIAEARGIEKEGRLEKLLKKPEVYKNFAEICLEADEKYNSGLFHFNTDERDDLTVDTFTLNLTIDDDVFKKIFKNLYPPNSPYEFSIISTEILGKIYEQFLGKIIRLTEGHHAKIDDKPEVKKAGGVYYTPQYIVDYIVEHTLGEKIKDLTPNQVSKIRVIDPACGSGSFLIRAYQKLLDHHLDYYIKMPRPPKDVIYEGRDGKLRLTITEKKRILKNNIYGVDIDTLAVEVTKLSLLLKVLEDQNKDLLEAQRKLINERALPNLSNNIKNGNSLISSDILEQQELSEDEYIRTKPFDWKDEFPEVFETGGFDCVIGNPPYINIENIEEIPKQYYMKNFSCFEKRADAYVGFLEQSLNLTKDYASFIIPSTIFTNTSYKKFRKYINNNNYLKELCYTGYDVFEEVTVDTTIIFMKKEGITEIKLIDALDFKHKIENTVKPGYFQNYGNVLSIDDKKVSQIMEKIFNNNFTTIKDHFKVFQGVVTGNNPAYLFESEEDAKNKGINEELLYPVVYGKDIARYEIKHDKNRLLYIDKNTDIKKYPETYNWLKQFKKELSKQKSKGSNWYQLHRPRVKEELDTQEKILIQATRNERLKIRTVATIDNTSVYAPQSIWFVIPKTSEYSLYFILPIINSNLINYLFATKFLNLGIKKDYINIIHIPKITQKEQKPLIELSQKMLKLHKELQNTNTPTERKLLQKQIELTDQKINEKVYELYNITQEEIEIIEQNL